MVARFTQVSEPLKYTLAEVFTKLTQVQNWLGNTQVGNSAYSVIRPEYTYLHLVSATNVHPQKTAFKYKLNGN